MPNVISKVDKLTITNQREGCFYFHVIKNKLADIKLEKRPPLSEINELESYINDELTHFFGDQSSHAAFIHQLEEMKVSSLGDESIYCWLEEDERACYFFWIYCLLHKIIESPYPIASNHQERLKYVIYSFDALLLDRSFLDKQMKMRKYKQMWANLYKYKKPFPWLCKSTEEICYRIWQTKIVGLEFSQKNPSFENPAKSYIPINYSEFCLAIESIYFNWPVPKQEKELLRKAINRNVAVYKYRIEKKQEQEQEPEVKTKTALNHISCHFSDETYQQLNNLALLNDISLEGVIERLIKKEHERLKQLSL